MMKKCFAILTAFLFLGSMSYSADKNIMPLPALQRSGDTGYICPNVDNTISLGTSTIEFKNAYFDGTVRTDVLTVDESATIATLIVTGDITGSADIRCTSFLGIGTPYVVKAVTATTIAVTGSNLHLINADGETTQQSITMTARPVFSTTTASVGDFLHVTTTHSTGATFVLDEGSSDKECLQLSGTITLGIHDSLLLILVSSGTSQTQTWWQQISTSNN